eukprot:1196155-Prorocentrum_minimum.AAC.8
MKIILPFTWVRSHCGCRRDESAAELIGRAYIEPLRTGVVFIDRCGLWSFSTFDDGCGYIETQLGWRGFEVTEVDTFVTGCGHVPATARTWRGLVWRQRRLETSGHPCFSGTSVSLCCRNPVTTDPVTHATNMRGMAPVELLVCTPWACKRVVYG